jgi:glycosyltransferase involved in cell wall biosynthesis
VTRETGFEAPVTAVELRPRFSVVVPALNEQFSIGDCLASLRQQDFNGGFEVIVVDNNSTDNTAAIARSFGGTVVHERQPGVCAARQRGTEEARGEIVVSTDADTTFDRGWLSGIDRTFVANPGAVAVAGPCRYFAAPWWGSLYVRTLFGMVHLVFVLTGHVFYVTATNFAFRKSAWTGYDTVLTQGGDELDLLRRLRARGRVAFDMSNPTLTSARRLHRGLLYNIVVTYVYYYLLGYWLNRLCHRTVLGTAPAFRGDARAAPSPWPRRLTALGVLVALAVLGRLAHLDLA